MHKFPSSFQSIIIVTLLSRERDGVTLVDASSHIELPVFQTRKPLKAVAMLSGDIAGTLYLTQQKPPLGPVDIDGFVQGKRLDD